MGLKDYLKEIENKDAEEENNENGKDSFVEEDNDDESGDREEDKKQKFGEFMKAHKPSSGLAIFILGR